MTNGDEATVPERLLFVSAGSLRSTSSPAQKTLPT